MAPTAEQLAQAFANDFWAANQEITWLAVEEERQMWLDEQTMLVGRIDARGRTPDGELFFAEWKTASASKARRMEEEKIKWRTDPQALTYGVLVPETKRFTVRWMLKTPKPQTDFEWYTYTQAEVDSWRKQLLGVAAEIRAWRASGEVPWRLNRGNCYRYGIAYKCPFVDTCHALEHSAPSASGRIPHLALERDAKAAGIDSNIVIIDASRTEVYLECPERYRRTYEGAGHSEVSEALTIGTEVHARIADSLRNLIR